MLQVQLKVLNPEISVPDYATILSAGVDLQASIDEAIVINPGEKSVLIPTGIAINIRDSHFGAFIFARSGLGHKNGLVLGNGTGVIDADYQGQIYMSACVRPGHDPIVIEPLARVAQLVFMPVERVAFEVVNEFSSITERGEGGFGHTGTK